MRFFARCSMEHCRYQGLYYPYMFSYLSNLTGKRGIYKGNRLQVAVADLMACLALLTVECSIVFYDMKLLSVNIIRFQKIIQPALLPQVMTEMHVCELKPFCCTKII